MNLYEKFKLTSFKLANNIGELGLNMVLSEKSKGIIKLYDLEYQKNARYNNLDFYFKPQNIDNEPKKMPVFFYIHGGGFLSGSKTPRRFYCYKWVEQGFFAVNINYRCGTKYPFPTFIQDTFKALEFVFDNKDKFNLDVDKIVLSGESAGAYICAMLCAFIKNESLYEKLNISFKYKEQFKVCATVLISGLYDMYKALELGFPGMTNCLMAFSGSGAKETEAYTLSEQAKVASPIYYVDKDFPPSVVIMSAWDKLTPSSMALCKVLSEKGVNYLQYVCSGTSGVHGGGICTKTKSGGEAFVKSAQFVKDIISTN